MKPLILLILFFFSKSVFAQNNLIKRKNYIDHRIETNAENIPIKKETFYFPVEFFPEYKISTNIIDSTSILIGSLDDKIQYFSTKIDKTIDSFHLKHFSNQLFELKEPLLFNRETNVEIYRFTWLRTFDNPISIRVEKSENSILIYTKIGKGISGYNSEGIKKENKRKVSTEEWDELNRLINDELNFWDLKFEGKAPTVDGSSWILEGSTSDLYSARSESSPIKGSKYYRTCRYLIELSKVKIDESKIY